MALTKTHLHKSENFKRGSHYLYVEHFAYNNRKLRYIIEFGSYTPPTQQIDVMREDGTWQTIITATFLACVIESTCYHDSVKDCQTNAEKIVSAFDDYIKAVY